MEPICSCRQVCTDTIGIKQHADHVSVLGITTAIFGVVTLFSLVRRTWLLLRRDSTCRPIGGSRWQVSYGNYPVNIKNRTDTEAAGLLQLELHDRLHHDRHHHYHWQRHNKRSDCRLRLASPPSLCLRLDADGGHFGCHEHSSSCSYVFRAARRSHAVGCLCYGRGYRRC